MTAPLRFSVLKQMGRSPAHCRYAMLHESPDTPAMKLGRLCHAITLGQPTGPVWAGDRRGRAWTEFKEAHQGEDIVTDSEFAAASEMAAAITCHPEAGALLNQTEERRFEETILFEFAGRKCRATPDAFDPVNLTEVKSTFDASPFRFPFHAERMGYTAQLSWQKHAIEAAGLERPTRLWIVAVESKPPYAVTVFSVTPAAEEFGRRLWRSWMEQFLVAEQSDQWPGYGPGTVDATEDSVELVMPGGEVLSVTDEDQGEADASDGPHGDQDELPLIGLPPKAAPGIMPSQLSRDDAERLAAIRADAIAKQKPATT